MGRKSIIISKLAEHCVNFFQAHESYRQHYSRLIGVVLSFFHLLWYHIDDYCNISQGHQLPPAMFYIESSLQKLHFGKKEVLQAKTTQYQLQQEGVLYKYAKSSNLPILDPCLSVFADSNLHISIRGMLP